MNYKTNTEDMSITIFRIIKLYLKGPKTVVFRGYHLRQNYYSALIFECNQIKTAFGFHQKLFFIKIFCSYLLE